MHLGNNLWKGTTHKRCHYWCRIQSVFWIRDMIHLLHMQGFNKEPSRTDERSWKCTRSNCMCRSGFVKAITDPNLFPWLLAETLVMRCTPNEEGTWKQLSGHNRLHSSNSRKRGIINTFPVSSQQSWPEYHSWWAGSILWLHLSRW